MSEYDWKRDREFLWVGCASADHWNGPPDSDPLYQQALDRLTAYIEKLEADNSELRWENKAWRNGENRVGDS